jgi:probable addiction module antidote protein
MKELQVNMQDALNLYIQEPSSQELAPDESIKSAKNIVKYRLQKLLNMPRRKDYREYMIEKLKDPKRALGYLNAVLEDCKDGSPESQQVLLLALKTIAQAQGGITAIAKKANLKRESLYRELSKAGNPKLTTLTALVSAMGFEFKLSLPTER